jgi:alanyl-tRNA synthetase
VTRRLYYDDSHLRTFSATVTGVRQADDRIEVSLDATAFYPGGGGQPPDQGRLGARDVLDAREDDGAVWHRIELPLEEGAKVEGEIAWPRRLDHMQQHTGQHVLSRAFVEVAGADTRSFHLGEQIVTIDVDHADPDDALLRKVEDRANQIVWEDRPVRAHNVTMEEALRFSAPEAAQGGGRGSRGGGGRIRLVRVRRDPCGAHGGDRNDRPARDRAIQRRNPRFVPLRWAGAPPPSRDRRPSARVCLEFTAGEGDLIRAVSRLKEERDSLDRRIKPLVREALEREAAELLADAVEGPGVRVVARHFAGRDPDEVGTLAAIVASAGGIALLISGEGASPRAHFCAPPGTISAAALMGDVSRRHGGRGGGRPESAQGTIPADRVEAALRDALEAVTAGTGKGQNA